MQATPVEEMASKKLYRVWIAWKKEHTGVSQEIVARQLGMKQSLFNHYLHGRRQPSLSTVLKLARFFNVHPEDIEENVEELRRMTFGSINLQLFHQAARLVRQAIEERQAHVPEETERNLIAHVYNRLAQRQKVDKDVVNLILDHALLSLA